MITASADYAEVYDKLSDVYPNMGAGELEQELARCMFVAEVWGRLSVETNAG
jgi:phage gp29-like protein